MKKSVNKKLSLVLLLSLVSGGKIFSRHGAVSGGSSHNPAHSVSQNKTGSTSNNYSNNSYADDTYSNGTFAGNDGYFGSGFNDYSNMNNTYQQGTDIDSFVNSLYNQNPQQFQNLQNYDQLSVSQQQSAQQQMAQQLINGQTQANAAAPSSASASSSSSSNSGGGNAIGLSDIINVAILSGVVFFGVKGIISLVHYLKDKGVKIQDMTEGQINRALERVKKALAKKGVDIDTLEMKSTSDVTDGKETLEGTSKDDSRGVTSSKKRLSDSAETKRAKLQNAQDKLDQLNKDGVKDVKGKGFFDKVNDHLNRAGNWVTDKLTGKNWVMDKLTGKKRLKTSKDQEEQARVAENERRTEGEHDI